MSGNKVVFTKFQEIYKIDRYTLPIMIGGAVFKATVKYNRDLITSLFVASTILLNIAKKLHC